MFLQVTSFIWITYLDSIVFTRGPIAYFFDEYFASWTAWLGCLFLVLFFYTEKAVVDAFNIVYNTDHNYNLVSSETFEAGRNAGPFVKFENE